MNYLKKLDNLIFQKFLIRIKFEYQRTKNILERQNFIINKKLQSFLSFIFLIFLFLTQVKTYATTYYQLIQNITFPKTSATKVYSSDKLFLCFNQQLNIYNLQTGALLQIVNFSNVNSGSTLDCFDAYQNNTYCLFNKGTTIIRYNVLTKAYDTYNNSVTKTGGKLLYQGKFSVTNSPTNAQIFIYNYQTRTGVFQKPLSGATTADYGLSVSIQGNTFFAFQDRRFFAYRHNPLTNLWPRNITVTLTPIIGSRIYWLTFSPKGDVFYYSKGPKIIQKRYVQNFTTISSSITYPTGIQVFNVQFTNNYGDELSIHLFNTTSLYSYIELYNLTSRSRSYKNMSANSMSIFHSMKVFSDKRIMILNYISFGCQIYMLKCPTDSVYSQIAGVCLYCNQTNECQPTYSALEQQMMQFSGRFYSNPTIRQSFKSFSYLFLALDRLWFYEYHNRTYGNNLKSRFQAVRRIQDLKFQFFSMIESAYQLLNKTQSSIQNITRYKPYTNYNYLIAQNKDGSFLLNSLDFLIFHIPGTFISFVLCRWLFFKLFNFKISTFFRLYAFWGYILVCLLEPNIEYFSFLLGNQFYLAFYFGPTDKLFCAFWICCLFTIIFFSISMILLLKYLYGNQVRHFMQNTFCVERGFAWIIFSVTIKRIYTGLCHSYLYYYPTPQLISLIFGQILETSFMLYLFKKYNIFKQKIGVSGRIIMNLIMITFQLSLLLTGFIDGDRTIQNLMDQQMSQVLNLLFINSFVFTVLSITASIVESIKSKYQVKQNTQQKKNSQEKQIIKNQEYHDVNPKSLKSFKKFQFKDQDQQIGGQILKSSKSIQKRNVSINNVSINNNINSTKNICLELDNVKKKYFLGKKIKFNKSTSKKIKQLRNILKSKTFKNQSYKKQISKRQIPQIIFQPVQQVESKFRPKSIKNIIVQNRISENNQYSQNQQQ